MNAWDWDFLIQITPRLIRAVGNTILAATGGYALALVVGVVLALSQRTSWTVITFVVREIMEFVRSTPLLLQIYFVFYVGPQFGIRMSPWTAGLLTIGIHYGCYLSEVFRGAIDGVPKGQWEACTALNLKRTKVYFRIILPQALPSAFAGMGNYLIGILKDTPMLAVIGVAELMHAANAVGAESYRFLEPYTAVGIIFLVLSLPLAALLHQVETAIRRSLGLVK